MLPNNVETFIGCDAEYEDAAIVLYGAPFDSTTSYRPARVSAAPRCGTKASVSKPTVSIRTKT